LHLKSVALQYQQRNRNHLRLQVSQPPEDTTPMSTTTALAGTFNSDPVHSSFAFAVKYQNVSMFRGTLG